MPSENDWHPGRCQVSLMKHFFLYMLNLIWHWLQAVLCPALIFKMATNRTLCLAEI